MSLLMRVGRWSAAATATAALSACGGGTKPSGAGAIEAATMIGLTQRHSSMFLKWVSDLEPVRL